MKLDLILEIFEKLSSTQRTPSNKENFWYVVRYGKILFRQLQSNLLCEYASCKGFILHIFSYYLWSWFAMLFIMPELAREHHRILKEDQELLRQTQRVSFGKPFLNPGKHVTATLDAGCCCIFFSLFMESCGIWNDQYYNRTNNSSSGLCFCYSSSFSCLGHNSKQSYRCPKVSSLN